jgi:hypothetical protein
MLTLARRVALWYAVSASSSSRVRPSEDERERVVLLVDERLCDGLGNFADSVLVPKGLLGIGKAMLPLDDGRRPAAGLWKDVAPTLRVIAIGPAAKSL